MVEGLKYYLKLLKIIDNKNLVIVFMGYGVLEEEMKEEDDARQRHA